MIIRKCVDSPKIIPLVVDSILVRYAWGIIIQIVRHSIEAHIVPVV